MSQSIVVKMLRRRCFSHWPALANANAACGGRRACVKDFRDPPIPTRRLFLPTCKAPRTRSPSTARAARSSGSPRRLMPTSWSMSRIDGAQKYLPHGQPARWSARHRVQRGGRALSSASSSATRVGAAEPNNRANRAALSGGCRSARLGVGPDGKTLWFTGKTKNTVGRIPLRWNRCEFYDLSNGRRHCRFICGGAATATCGSPN